jgi:hypothetical protein
MLFVQGMLGKRPNLATLAGLAFSATGLAGVLAVPGDRRRPET